MFAARTTKKIYHSEKMKRSGLAGLGFIPAGFFGFNPLLALTTNLGFKKNEA
jgi:hypothetical protein